MLLLYCRVIIKYCQYSHYFNRKKNEPPRGVLLKDAPKVLKISFIQSETLASSAEFLRWFLIRHFAWKPAVASQNVVCFQAEFIENESINPFTAKCSQRQISTRFPNFILYNFEKQIVPCVSAGRELSFEWSHHMISSTDSKVKATLQNSIKHSGSERVKPLLLLLLFLSLTQMHLP